MGLLQKELAVSIFPLENNDSGDRIQGRLKGVDRQYIVIAILGQPPFPEGSPLLVEFWIDRSVYKFETSLKYLKNGLLYLEKPEVINRSKLREGPRVSYNRRLHYTLWSEPGRFEADLQDISETGLRMMTRRPLAKNALISIDFYIKEAKMRIICQALIAWCRQTEENEYLYDTGIQFTTLSNENRKKLARFLENMAVD